jgi:hypothetical protein
MELSEEIMNCLYFAPHGRGNSPFHFKGRHGIGGFPELFYSYVTAVLDVIL